MEGEEYGKHCMFPGCQQLDFLPIECKDCHQLFCNQHSFSFQHNCPALSSSRISPACPICNQIVFVGPDEDMNEIMNSHIESGCRFRTRESPPLPKKPICSVFGCTEDFMSPFLCPHCHKTFCMTHRLPENHGCSGVPRSKSLSPPPTSSQKSLSPSSAEASPERKTSLSPSSSSSTSSKTSFSTSIMSMFPRPKPKPKVFSFESPSSSSSSSSSSSLFSFKSSRSALTGKSKETLAKRLKAKNVSSVDFSKRRYLDVLIEGRGESECYCVPMDARVGRVIDLISSLAKVPNKNNIPGEKKLCIFLRGSEEPLPMEMKIEHLVERKEDTLEVTLAHCQ